MTFASSQHCFFPRRAFLAAGGKILLLERGAFAGIHAAKMAHPAPFDMLRAKIIAASMFEVHCTGKESHASAFPELGVNAADSLTIAQTALGLLRQHQTWRLFTAAIPRHLAGRSRISGSGRPGLRVPPTWAMFPAPSRPSIP